jgi:cystathionine gamma-synthase/cystathionine gamma-lyase/cystathionine beta-lyase
LLVPAPESTYRSLETRLLHAGRHSPSIEGAVIGPIFQTAQYLMGQEAEYGDVRYIRLNNSPNHLVLHHRLAAIEGAEAGLVTSSGMAAITTVLLSHLKQGDHVLAHRSLYGGTQTFLSHEARGLGIEHTSIDMTDPSGWEAALRPSTRLIYVEGISNPLMDVGDLRAVVAFARRHELVSVIDNTFATPVNFRPIELGFDLVVHSATKYLNGHSDLVAGAVVGSHERIDRVRHVLNHLGGSLDPHACFLLERGMKTLAVRVERQNRSALELARFLSARPAVRQVRYPGLETDPGHRRARDLFSGFGGMLAFYTRTAAQAESVLRNLRIPLHAPSLGGMESLVVRPSRSSHLGLTEPERQAIGVTDELIRVSVGLEAVDELIADFEQALSAAAT